MNRGNPVLTKTTLDPFNSVTQRQTNHLGQTWYSVRTKKPMTLNIFNLMEPESLRNGWLFCYFLWYLSVAPKESTFVIFIVLKGKHVVS